MSSASTGTREYFPLGLPPGSVRAILTYAIVGLFLAFLLMPPDKQVSIPLYLYGLLPMVLLFFAAHGRSIRPAGSSYPSPLFLPRGTLRLLLVAGFVAVIGWEYHDNRDLLLDRLTPEVEQLGEWPPILLTLGLGFLVGHLLGLGPWRNRPVFQNIVAWLSLLAMLMLLAEIVIELVIKPQLVEGWDLLIWHCILTGVVTLYFGARS